MVLEVQQVNEGVIVQRERFYNLPSVKRKKTLHNINEIQMRLKMSFISHYFFSPDRVDVAESLQINIGKLSDNSLDA